MIGDWKSKIENLSQLQRCQREQREHQRCDPEANNNLRLRPSHQLKMMMDRAILNIRFFRSL